MADLPKIAKDAARVRAMIEEAFTRMARRHKYTTGVDLRAAAKAVVVAVIRAWRAYDDKPARLRELSEEIDVLKLELKLGKDVDAFKSWKEFEAIVRLVNEVGRQSGGWLNERHSKGQNARARKSSTQRAPILSSFSASQGATP